MATPSYANEHQEKELSIAIEKVLIAPYPTTWSPTPIVLPTLPSSAWFDLGFVDEGATSLTVTKEKFQIRAGLPRTLRYEAVLGVSGTFKCTLRSSSARKVYYALGNTLPINIFTNTAAYTIISTPAATRGVFTLATSPANSWVLGDVVVTAVTTPGMDTTANEAYVSSINGLTVAVSPWFVNTPAVDNFISKILGVKQPFGTALKDKFHILGVADFVDGYQVIHDFAEVTPSGDFTEEIRSDREGQIPMSFELYGYTSSTYEASSQYIVGERYWFKS